jgi:hypothetical protein
MKTEKIRPVLVLLFASALALLLILPIADRQTTWRFNAMMAGIALALLVPAIAFVRGVRWCRFVVATVSLLFLLLWTLSPIAQHSFDRHAGFWALWTFIEALTIGAVWASLKKEPIQSATDQRP